MKRASGQPAFSQRQHDQLRAFEELLRHVALPMGLVSAADAGRLWERHILDSLRGLGCLAPRPASIADVGSGAGLPGVPLAIAIPDSEIHLIDSRGRSVGFLELAVQQVGLSNVTVVGSRVEELDLSCEVATARALGSASASWRLASRVLRPGGFLVYYAGESWGESSARALARLGVGAQVCVAPSADREGPLVKIARLPP